ncbi:MAG TPA: FtsX-like permease family protein [Planctomycetota bacterium]|nr:FtsX-like permease family protein [Planctomycetota bacterium]
MKRQGQSDSPLLPRYLLLLSFRYLRSRFSALAALSSVTFGVAVILIVLSIMGGYIEKLRETIRGQESHIIVTGPRPLSVTDIVRVEQLIEADENVLATAPYIETLAMYKSLQFNPCHLRGILPARETRVSTIGRYVLRPEELDRILDEIDAHRARGTDEERPDALAGRLNTIRRIDEILDSPTRDPPSGEELDRFFQAEYGLELLRKRNPAIVPALEDEVPPAILVGIHFLVDRQMLLGQVVPIVTVKPDTSEPRPERFLVAGAFKTGDYDFDSHTILVHLDALKNVMDLHDPKTGSYRYEGLHVALKDLSRLDETQMRLKAALARDDPTLEVHTWEDRRRQLLTAVQIEKFLIYFLLVLLMSFTGCMVLLMLLLTVIEKTRDMGILLALGATPGGVTSIFLVNGLLISAAGTVLGLAIGYAFCFYINPIHDWIHARTGLELFAAEIYHMDRIPIAFQLTDVLLSISPPIILGFLASLIPAHWASRRDPIKAIHYE